VWIDPLFPELLTVEDNVFIGREARIGMHTFSANEFRAGKVLIRSGAVIGAFSIVGPGVEVGSGATVAVAAVVGRDLPAGSTALGNPARIVKSAQNTTEEAT
jgi:acetyltransferase-like isoleucine patch superfamily enzyme